MIGWPKGAGKLCPISLVLRQCRGGRNRTHAKGFGDLCTTIILRPYHIRAPPSEALVGLFCFFMHGMLFAELTKFCQLQAVLQRLFVLGSEIIGMLAFGCLALHFH